MFDRRNGLVPIAQNRLSSAFGCVAIDVRAPFGVVHHVIHTTPGGTDSGLQLGFPNVTSYPLPSTYQNSLTNLVRFLSMSAVFRHCSLGKYKDLSRAGCPWRCRLRMRLSLTRIKNSDVSTAHANAVCFDFFSKLSGSQKLSLAITRRRGP